MNSTALWLAFVDVSATLEEAGSLGRYLLVFVLAMVPAIEPFIVIPVAIGLGFDPLLTGLAAFAGSATAVVAIVLAAERLTEWLTNRTSTDATDSSSRYDRARRIWNRYGVVGLALGGPILAGIHLTALVATVVGSDGRTTVGWLTIGLAVWTVVLVVGSLAGFSALGVL